MRDDLTPIRKFHKGMRGFFKVDPRKFLDTLYLQMVQVKLDLFKFDDWLHEKHGDYEDDGLSMGEAIEKFYSKEASAFVKSFL